MSLLFVDQDILILHLKQLSSFWGVLYFTEKQAEVQAKTLKRIIDSNLATKQDILMLQKDIAETKGDLQKEIAETKAGIIKWVAGMLLAQSAVVATLVKLL
ncbi:hypothetical protein BuS5_00064 [Desulfosarcina sp. BuS5]|uniref:hypothetical protein n=1 Tax=Desulfosarcina sp. BuS5 TaxID=933262 RepID=UPI00055757FF|nr:hypothetical protein [Desulfosarcina sp. BuS5]WDN87096.1 hypothetical protein BuS5_00064 [Desulfosarcina sp. BuS5]